MSDPVHDPEDGSAEQEGGQTELGALETLLDLNGVDPRSSQHGGPRGWRAGRKSRRLCTKNENERHELRTICIG